MLDLLIIDVMMQLCCMPQLETTDAMSHGPHGRWGGGGGGGGVWGGGVGGYTPNTPTQATCRDDG